MRIQVLSDLHIEFGAFDFPRVDADLVVLAGDVHVKLNGVRWIKENIPDTPVVYLAGNHEYYGEKIPRLRDKIREEAEGTNIHFLENEFVEFGGYRIFGATLWTDMELLGDHHVGCLEAVRMNDYKRIRKTPSYQKLRPVDTRLLHAESVRSIRQFLEAGDSRRSVIVTHHAPSIRSLPHRRRTEPISCAYASNLDSFIENLSPLLWIHGHIHHSQDYEIGDTRILSNPRAYLDDPNPSFDPELVVDLG
ncbi:metallophosphoesterase [Roseibacillus ishigakijimensis]|uniref:metallophosphoesterase n=1 Tax=Roseibacillus ishigakijimensis TaxID=454146 RepID=UPI001F36C122|nr:metallophosphoesterase [Roseibacillus ishigakijimensis]